MLLKNGLAIHDSIDHINPASWRGNVKVSQVVLQTCWKLGRLQIEEEFPFVASILHEATNSLFDIFSPLGTDLESHMQFAWLWWYNDGTSPLPWKGLAPESDLENTVAEEDTSGKHDPCFELDGKQVYKTQYLNQAFAHHKKTGSTDQLKCVANIDCYFKPITIHNDVFEHDPTSSKSQVQMDSPIAMVVWCDSHVFLYIGEVNDITVDSWHTDHIGVEYLTEPSVFVLYQMLEVIPASVEDDPNLKHDWQWLGKWGSSHRVSGCLIQPINPSLSTQQLGNPFICSRVVFFSWLSVQQSLNNFNWGMELLYLRSGNQIASLIVKRHVISYECASY